MNKITIKHPKRLIAISVCVVVALCGAALALLTANGDENSIQPNNDTALTSANANDDSIPMESGTGGDMFCWAYDPTDIRLVEDEADAIAKVKYTGKKRAYKAIKEPGVVTAYTVDVLEVLKGAINEKHIEIIAAGGVVSLKEWNDNSVGDSKESSDEIRAMSDSELRAATMGGGATDYGVDLQKDDVAIAFLHYSEDSGEYHIMFAGLSLFEQTENGDYANPKLSPVVIDDATINEIKKNN
jgi:hypothetical protein